MSDFPVSYIQDKMKLTAAQWRYLDLVRNRAQIAVLAAQAWPDGLPADNTGAVVGGLGVSTVAGTMRVAIDNGVGLWKDSSLFGTTLDETVVALERRSEVGVFITHEPVEVDVSQGDALHPRKDLVCVKPGQATGHTSAVMWGPSSPNAPMDNSPLLLESVAEVLVVPGTPAASPQAPAPPADYIVLAHVTVPPMATNLDGATVEDQRPSTEPNAAIAALWQAHNQQASELLTTGDLAAVAKSSADAAQATADTADTKADSNAAGINSLSQALTALPKVDGFHVAWDGGPTPYSTTGTLQGNPVTVAHAGDGKCSITLPITGVKAVMVMFSSNVSMDDPSSLGVGERTEAGGNTTFEVQPFDGPAKTGYSFDVVVVA